MLHVSSRKGHHQARINKKKAVNLNCYCHKKYSFIITFSFTWITIKGVWLRCFFFIYSWLMMTPPAAGSSPGEKIIFVHRTKSGPDKNLYTKSERLALRWRVISASPENFKLRNRQITFLPGKGNHMQHTQAPSPVPDCRVSVICTGFHPLASIVPKGRNM
jgi:hypothetical protein